MGNKRKRQSDQHQEQATDPGEVFAWAAQLHRAADLVEEHAAGRDMTVREVLAEMPNGPEREELISLLSLPPVAARLGVPMDVIEISPGAPPSSRTGEASAREAGRDPDKNAARKP